MQQRNDYAMAKQGKYDTLGVICNTVDFTIETLTLSWWSYGLARLRRRVWMKAFWKRACGWFTGLLTQSVLARLCWRRHRVRVGRYGEERRLRLSVWETASSFKATWQNSGRTERTLCVSNYRCLTCRGAFAWLFNTLASKAVASLRPPFSGKILWTTVNPR